MAMRDRRTERQTILFVVAFSGMLFGLSYALVDTTLTATRLGERVTALESLVQTSDAALTRARQALDGKVCFNEPPQWVFPTKHRDM